MMVHLNSRSRGFDGDLSQGRWRGTSCAFCGTMYRRSQPHKLRESTQGETYSCDNCGNGNVRVEWGRLVPRDGGVYFEPDPALDTEDVTQNHQLTADEIERLK